MDSFFEVLMVMAVSVNRIIELIKPRLHAILPESSWGWSTLLLSMVLGVLGTLFMGTANILDFSNTFGTVAPPIIGVVLTGLLVGFMSNIIADVGDFVEALKGWLFSSFLSIEVTEINETNETDDFSQG